MVKNYPLYLIPPTANNNYNFKQFPNKNKSFRFLYAGTFRKKDGLETLIKAFSNFNKKYPDSELILIGKSDNTEFLDTLKINPKIKYLGPFYGKEYYEKLLESDVLCMTRTNSKFANAGFPYKIGEYLSSGKPVICSKVSDIAFYLENKKDAMIFEPDCENELYNCMEYLYLKPDEAKSIGERGKQKAEHFFSYERNGKLFLDFMKE